MSMNSKLTLKLDKNILKKAKEYASLRNLSLSKLVEVYFQKLIIKEEFKQKLSPRVRKLSGILKGKDLNYKSELEDSLRRKYLN
jgi:antitoxin component of RelBE/YafQ-DinJ toxin-antitoxin module